MGDTNETTAAPAPSTLTRTSQGLRDALFDEMNALRSGTSTPARARSVAMLANSILQSVTIEIEYHKYVSDVSNTLAGSTRLGSLALGKVKLGDDESAPQLLT